MVDYINGLLFTERQTSPQLQKLFDDFKVTGKSPPNAYSKSKFNKLLKQKYDQDLQQIIGLEDIEKKKKREEFLKQGKINDFWEQKVYEEQPAKTEIKRIRKEYQQEFGETLTGEEILKNIKIQPKAPVPPPEAPIPPEPDKKKKGRKTKAQKIEEGIEAVVEAGGNDLIGIQKQLEALDLYIIKEDRTRLNTLKKKTHLTEKQQKQLEGLEEMIKETEDRKILLKQRQAILKDYTERGLIPEDIDHDFLPEVLDFDMTADEYEGQLLTLSSELETESETEEEQSE